MSLKVSRLLANPACMADVLTSRSNEDPPKSREEQDNETVFGWTIEFRQSLLLDEPWACGWARICIDWTAAEMTVPRRE
jgi:hypothetical protein